MKEQSPWGVGRTRTHPDAAHVSRSAQWERTDEHVSNMLKQLMRNNRALLELTGRSMNAQFREFESVYLYELHPNAFRRYESGEYKVCSVRLFALLEQYWGLPIHVLLGEDCSEWDYEEYKARCFHIGFRG